MQLVCGKWIYKDRDIHGYDLMPRDVCIHDTEIFWNKRKDGENKSTGTINPSGCLWAHLPK